MKFAFIAKKLQLTITGVVVVSISSFVASTPAHAAGFGYITGSNPWGTTINDQAMDTAFGGGNWNKLDFATAGGAGIFNSGAYEVLFFDGSDLNGEAFRSFLDTNRTNLVSWVSSGGSLFLNAARNNSFGDLDLGFGATLKNDHYATASYTGTAVNPNHPIFNGPNGVTGTEFSGDLFAHDTVVGTGLTSIINGSSGSVLAEKKYGAGHVLLGGLTTPNFHQPQPEATILRANILSYAKDYANGQPTPVPTPALLPGLIGLGMGVLRKRKAEAAEGSEA